MPEHNYIYKNFMPNEKGEWQETANDEHLPTFLERYEIEIPCGCEFMRFKNEQIYCWIYVYAMRISIKIFCTYDK